VESDSYTLSTPETWQGQVIDTIYSVYREKALKESPLLGQVVFKAQDIMMNSIYRLWEKSYYQLKAQFAEEHFINTINFLRDYKLKQTFKTAHDYAGITGTQIMTIAKSITKNKPLLNTCIRSVKSFDVVTDRYFSLGGETEYTEEFLNDAVKIWSLIEAMAIEIATALQENDKSIFKNLTDYIYELIY